jgi:hypothetical protein
MLRLHEIAGQRGSVQIQPTKGWAIAQAHFDGTAKKLSENRTLFKYEPYQILTVRFQADLPPKP